MNRMVLWPAALAVLLPASVAGADKTLTLTVAAGKHDRINVPVVVPLSLPANLANTPAVLVQRDKASWFGQLTAPGLLTESLKPSGKGLVRRDLHFILLSLKAGTSATLKVTLGSAPKGESPFSFSWKDVKGEYAELSTDSRPVLRYMDRPLDDSSKAAREQTFKVYHHLYDPTGKMLVTKGPGGLFPHHRGLFYGFRIIHYGDHTKPVDIWHCTGDTYQSHERFLSTEAGPVLGRHRVLIAWHGHKKEVFAQEERELTVYAVPGGTLVEFASRLRSTNGTIKLDGDPQHAGFHFRAAQEVAAKTKQQTYFLRPDGAGKRGETRNWPQNKGHVNLPWDAMSFVLGGQRYTVAYLDKPTNPKEARYSERDYGRFGSYFVTEVTRARPLLIDYRIWLQQGEMKGPDVARLSADFVTPVEVTVK